MTPDAFAKECARSRGRVKTWLPFLNLCTGNPPDVTGIVHCLAVFVGAQFGLQVNGLAANHAGYFREVRAIHKTPLLIGGSMAA
jgi:hypothetical protein